MMRKKLPLGIITTFLVLILLSACSPSIKNPDQTAEVIPGITKPIISGDVELLVHEARLRGNYQTHYIMTYAEPGTIFYEVILSIDGAQDPLLWGKSNLILRNQDQEYPLVMARPKLIGEDIEYKAGEDFTHHYAYLFNIPLDSDYETYQLGLVDGSHIPLDSIVVDSKYKNTSEAETEAGEFSVLAGGKDNQVVGPYSTVSGGSQNLASAYHTSIGGGILNVASASHGTVGGGRENQATNFYTTVGGGYANTASGRDSTVSGGSRNIASNHHAAVGGGIQNQASSTDSTIAGGGYNLASDVYATVGGGTRNQASGYASTISGGAGNHASGELSAISGGLGNDAGGIYSAIGGGHANSAQGDYAVVPGGMLNQASGDYGFAAGQRAIIESGHAGVFLFADSSDLDFRSAAANEFAVRANGGVRFVTAITDESEPLSGVMLKPGSGSWSSLSDRKHKTNFESVDGDEILDALAKLSISTWNYTAQEPSIRHIGPSAQDFQSVFGLGEDNHYISSIDADGVALAAIQGLYLKAQEQETMIESQQERIQELEARIQRLEQGGSQYAIEFNPNAFWGLCVLFSIIGSLASVYKVLRFQQANRG